MHRVICPISFVLLLGFAAPPASAVCTEDSHFAGAVASTTGPNPHFSVAADFNNDGMIDLAVTNADLPNAGTQASSVAILLATGPRTFASAVTYPVDREPHGMVVGDFNADGILDLVTANKFGRSVSILRGLGSGGIGNGTFAPAVHYPTVGYAFQIVTADFNGDGIQDLAVSINSVASINVLFGQGSGGAGDGTFGPPVAYALQNLSTGIEKGDFNSDGITDLVATANYAGKVGVLIGLGSGGVGNGSFAPAVHYSAGPEPFDVDVDDFNDDGIADLAVSNAAQGGTAILIGHGVGGAGDGTFSAPAFIPSGNSAVVEALDANDDGITDLAVGEFTGANTGRVRLYLGQGSGGVGNGAFAGETDYPIGADAYQATVADLDQDGMPDLVVAAALLDYVAVLYGACVEAPPDPRFPVLTDVRDVPNDEGGRVFVTWTASSLDASGGPINAYRVWRRIAPAVIAASGNVPEISETIRAIPAAGAEAATIEYWEALVTLPAQRLAGYGYTATTTQDSMRLSNPFTAFFVTALTSNIDIFYSSNVDSGYSVDNLPPFGPRNFGGQVASGAFQLSWDENEEADLMGYRLYRGETEDFTLSDESLIAAPTTTTYVDEESVGQHFYKLTAVDSHGNESSEALVRPIVVSGVLGSPALALAIHGVRPNPSLTGEFVVHFVLPRTAPARLQVVDVGGRQVLTRDLSDLRPGPHAVTISQGAGVAPGIYVVRLVQDGRSVEAKAVVLR